MYKALTISGMETHGSAGIQADLKTFQEFGVFGLSALTAIITRNSRNNWSNDVFPVSLDAVEAQLDVLLREMGVDAVKIGMLPTAEIIALVAKKIMLSSVQSVVVDPAIANTKGRMGDSQAAACLREMLAPIATIITPNIIQAKQLSGVQIRSADDMKEAAKRIYSFGSCYVLIRSGSKYGCSNGIDLLYDGKDFEFLEVPKSETAFTYGAGSTFAAAITAGLARGSSVFEAVMEAKQLARPLFRRDLRLSAI